MFAVLAPKGHLPALGPAHSRENRIPFRQAEKTKARRPAALFFPLVLPIPFPEFQAKSMLPEDAMF